MRQLRPYQREAYDSIYEALRYERRALCVASVGCGKTVVAASVAADWPHGRVVMLVHRDELLQQAVRKFYDWTGQWPAIEQAGQFSNEASHWGRSQFVVASVQSLHSGRLTAERFNDVGLVIPDEAHHCAVTSKLWGRVLNTFEQKNPECRFLGLTATPTRADGEKLLFDRYAFKFPMLDAIHDGWLVPIQNRIVVVKSLDLSTVKKNKGELNQEQLAAQVEQERPSYEIAASAVEIAGSKQTLGFTVTVAQAKLLSDVCNALRPGKSAWMSGDRNQFPTPLRREIIHKFETKEIQFLWNCALFTEGTDLPGIEMLCLARPTASTSLYTQMLGRALRPLPGVVDDPALANREDRARAIRTSPKPHALVIDFCDNSRRHDLVNVCSPGILGGRFSEAEIAQATKDTEERAARGEDTDAERALAEARRRLEEEEDRRRQQAREAISVQVDYDLINADLFDPMTQGAVRKVFAPQGPPPSEAQAKLLRDFGFNPERVTKKQASGIISKIKQGKIKRKPKAAQAATTGAPAIEPFDVNRVLLES